MKEIKNYVENLKVRESKERFTVIVYGEHLIFENSQNKIATEKIRGITEARKLEDGAVYLDLMYPDYDLKGLEGITIEREDFEKIVNIEKEISAMIDTYFNELDNVEVEKHGKYWILNTEKYNEFERLHSVYAREKHQEWIEKNKNKFSYLKEGFSYNYLGNIEDKIDIYTFNKDIKEEDIKVKPRSKKEPKKISKETESEGRYNKLYELAEKLTDEEFEDITGLPREHFII